MAGGGGDRYPPPHSLLLTPSPSILSPCICFFLSFFLVLGRQRLVVDISNSPDSIRARKRKIQRKKRGVRNGDIYYLSAFLPVYLPTYLGKSRKKEGATDSTRGCEIYYRLRQANGRPYHPRTQRGILFDGGSENKFYDCLF